MCFLILLFLNMLLKGLGKVGKKKEKKHVLLRYNTTSTLLPSYDKLIYSPVSIPHCTWGWEDGRVREKKGQQQAPQEVNAAQNILLYISGESPERKTIT